MTSLVWLVFALYLNHMIDPMMFPKIHMRTTRTRNQTKFKYSSVPYGHVLVALRVPFRILQLVGLQEPVAPYSYKRTFQLVSFVILLLRVLSYIVRLLSKLLLGVEDLILFPSLHHYNVISLPIFH